MRIEVTGDTSLVKSVECAYDLQVRGHRVSVILLDENCIVASEGTTLFTEGGETNACRAFGVTSNDANNQTRYAQIWMVPENTSIEENSILSDKATASQYGSKGEYHFLVVDLFDFSEPKMLGRWSSAAE
jgi:hypothetical protein